MNAVENPDYATLRWVREGLDETIQLARQALEAYEEGGFQGEGIDRFHERVHQLLGTLRMVQVHGGVMLVEEMEQVAQALIEGRLKADERLAESLMLGLVQLPGYLQRLERGEPDIPLALLPVLNDLRAARGLAPASEIVLYAPNLDRLVEREPVIPGSGNEELPQLIHDLRPRYHKGLLQWYRHSNDQQGLGRVLEVVRSINAVAGTRRLRRLMDAAEALVVTLVEGEFAADDHVKQLFSRLDQVFRQLMEQGEEAAMTQFPMELLKHMLYFVSRSHSHDPVVQSVKRTADLANSFPERMEAASVGAGLDAGVLEAVFGELRSELEGVQERLDLYMRGDREELHHLEGLGDRVRKVADTLGMLGKGALRERLVEVATRLDDMAAGRLQPDDEQLMAMATTLVEAERTSAPMGGGMAIGPLPAEEEKEDEQAQKEQAVIREASRELSVIKEGLERYLHDPDERAQLAHVAEEVHKLAGIFDVAGLEDLADLLKQAEPELQRLQQADVALDPHQQGALVDLFAAFDYYLEARLDGRARLDDILDLARGSLEQLQLEAHEFQGEVPPEFTAEGDSRSEDELIHDEAGETSSPEEIPEPPAGATSEEAESSTREETPPEQAPEPPAGAEESGAGIGTEAPPAQTEAVVFTEMDQIDPEIFDIFVEEAGEELETIRQQYPRWRADQSDESALETFRRSFHTLKGSGRMVGAEVIGELAWSVENLLNRIMDGTVTPDQAVLKHLDQAVEALPLLLEAQEKGQPAPVDVKALEARGFELAERAAAPETEVQTADAESSAATGPTGGSPVEVEIEAPAEAVRPELELPEDLYDVFLAESRDHLDRLEQFRAELGEGGPIDPEALRAIHTLRGSSHLAGMEPLAELAGAMERYCTHLHQLGQSCGASERDYLERFLSVMNGLLDVINQPGALPDWRSLQAELEEAEQALPEVISDLKPASDSELLAEPAAEQELKNAYLEEAVDLLETIDAHFQRWQAGEDQAEAVDGIKRALHTLKGGARMVGFAPLGDLAEGLERWFGLLQEQPDIEVDETTRQTLRGLVERFEDALDALHLNGKLPDLEAPVAQARALVGRMEEETAAIEPASEPLSETEEEPESILLAETWQGEEAHHPESATLAGSGFGDTTAPLLPLPEGVDPELLEVFLEEAGELTERLEEHLGAWEAAPTSSEAIDGTMRVLHTFKGNARFASLFDLGDLSHALESIFRGLAEEELAPNETLPPLVRHGVDRLESAIELLQKGVGYPDVSTVTRLLEAAAAGQPVDLSELDTGTSQIEAITESLLHETSSLQIDASSLQQDSSLLASSQVLTDSELLAEKTEPAQVVPFPGEKPSHGRRRPPPLQAEEEQTGRGERVRVRAELLDQLVNNAGEVSIYRARLERQNRRVEHNLEELNATIARLRTQLRALELETEAQIRSRHERDLEEHRYEEFDPLEMDRYSTLQQLSRALSETISDLSNIGETLSEQARDADTLLLQQERITNELQDGLLRSRMVPFKRQASRLQRVVRQTAQTLGKQAELHVEGAEGEIDRSILNRMVGPLEHLLRNAVAHGIEPPDKRRRLGKPERGQVTLSMAREGSDVVLTIADDGAGLDAGAIRRKAVASGLLEPGTEIDEGTLFQFILQPGFTTADQVNQVAGRGVGMDAVVSEIKQLGGSLDIQSKMGQGSRFIIRLPFTLAISEALLVRVMEEVYAIPHGSLEVIIRVAREDLLACYRGESEGVHYGGHLYPVRYMGSMLGIGEPVLPDNLKWFPLLLARAGEQRMAIQVDQLIGNQQVVVKSIGAQLAGVRWFTGGTILADGKIALLMDMNALIRSAAVAQTPVVPEPEPREAQGITVMVVDDSITVRKVTSRLLERHNMQVITAKDGVDAITVLQDRKPDIMLLDIEMPRMDGYELARHIRNTPELEKIPIIMITSRTGEKHRQRALEIGVDRYLGKPYQENDLLDNIYALLGERLQ